MEPTQGPAREILKVPLAIGDTAAEVSMRRALLGGFDDSRREQKLQVVAAQEKEGSMSRFLACAVAILVGCGSSTGSTSTGGTVSSSNASSGGPGSTTGSSGVSSSASSGGSGATTGSCLPDQSCVYGQAAACCAGEVVGPVYTDGCAEWCCVPPAGACGTGATCCGVMTCVDGTCQPPRYPDAGSLGLGCDSDAPCSAGLTCESCMSLDWGAYRCEVSSGETCPAGGQACSDSCFGAPCCANGPCTDAGVCP